MDVEILSAAPLMRQYLLPLSPAQLNRERQLLAGCCPMVMGTSGPKAALSSVLAEWSDRNGLSGQVRPECATEHFVADCATFKDVANMCGATGRVTLRQAAEREGLTWPTSAEDFLAAMSKV
ncbi:MAG: hypothetical protein EOP24_32915 [Hyphomicrobiales bacterium]|nr:MAG: hypothetical protein EOP24_32915 [Hyphomicrobiales bacterium]